MSDESPTVNLGRCCCCGRAGRAVRNIVMLPRLAPERGTGWGCVQCGLPTDGAVYVACDACVERHAPPVEVCLGLPASLGRWPVEDLGGEVFEHDMSRHPGD
jgi:hypothetical protein